MSRLGVALLRRAKLLISSHLQCVKLSAAAPLYFRRTTHGHINEARLHQPCLDLESLDAPRKCSVGKFERGTQSLIVPVNMSFEELQQQKASLDRNRNGSKWRLIRQRWTAITQTRFHAEQFAPKDIAKRPKAFGPLLSSVYFSGAVLLNIDLIPAVVRD